MARLFQPPPRGSSAPFDPPKLFRAIINGAPKYLGGPDSAPAAPENNRGTGARLVALQCGCPDPRETWRALPWVCADPPAHQINQ